MKLSLVVLTPGKMEGKAIPITVPQFVIGRDPQCNLRPASALVSKRHCVLTVRDTRIFVRDFDSINGTRINDDPLKGEQKVYDQANLRVGPRTFRVSLQTRPPVSRPTPMPPTTPPACSDDGASGAMLLTVQDEPGTVPGSLNVDSEGVPTGSTVMDIISPTSPTPPAEAGTGGAGREQAAKAAAGNTSSAAKAILEKYMRRPRS